MFPALEFQVTASLSVLTLILLVADVLDDPEVNPSTTLHTAS